MMPTALGPEVAASPTNLDLRDGRMECILLSLMDTFGTGTGTDARIPHADLKSWQCHADVSSWQSQKCGIDRFDGQKLTGPQLLEQPFGCDTQKTKSLVPEDPFEEPWAPTADTLPTTAMIETLDAIPTQDLPTFESLPELHKDEILLSWFLRC
mmetsp:Transcript_68779/g.136082  ORF Transcript_68779/g.136082 Transcript_68779/m.136082 type:complete len:154 (+) Transcript_68779:106-567(+)